MLGNVQMVCFISSGSRYRLLCLIFMFLKNVDIAFRTKIILKFRCIISLELLTVQRFQAVVNLMGSSDVLLLVILGL